jgi:hypothetical protein
MEKIKNYENFEVDDDNKDEAISKLRQYHLLAKIVIILSVIIVFQIINLLVIYSSIKETNSDISNINLKKYMLADGNKKLDRSLKDAYEKDYAYDEETAKKDNEIKSKEKLTKEYIKKARKLQKKLNNTQPLEDLLEINNKKRQEIEELKNGLNEGNKQFRNDFNTKIFDSFEEIDSMKLIIKNNVQNLADKDEINLNKCFNYDIANGKEIDYNEISYAVNFNENKVYLLIFQTNNFGRYGSVITDNENHDNYLIFDLNNKNKDSFETEWMKFKMDRQSIQLFLNTIKEFKFEMKNKEFDYNKYTNITEIELYKVY